MSLEQHSTIHVFGSSSWLRVRPTSRRHNYRHFAMMLIQQRLCGNSTQQSGGRRASSTPHSGAHFGYAPSWQRLAAHQRQQMLAKVLTRPAVKCEIDGLVQWHAPVGQTDCRLVHSWPDRVHENGRHHPVVGEEHCRRRIEYGEREYENNHRARHFGFIRVGRFGFDRLRQSSHHVAVPAQAMHQCQVEYDQQQDGDGDDEQQVD